MKTLVVSTFNRAGWDLYAHRMESSFRAHWPAEFDLMLFSEDTASGGAIYPPRMAQKIARFMSRHKDNPAHRGIVPDPINGGTRYNFKFDAVKFAHKVFAIEQAAYCSVVDYDRLIWIDADVVTLRPVPVDFIDGFMSNGANLGCLTRTKKNKSTETGFVIFNICGPVLNLIARMAAIYETDHIFQLAEWHDAFVFDYCRAQMPGLRVASLSGAYESHGHPFINGPLGQYMDHLKGDARKKAGQSRASDFIGDAPWHRAAL